MIRLLIIFATCSTASIKLIPEAIKVAIVRENVAAADLIVRLPNNGNLMPIFAYINDPGSVLPNAFKPNTIAATIITKIYHLCCKKLLKFTSICVAAGSSDPKSSNICENCGITPTSNTATTATTTIKITIGYVTAPFTFECSAFAVSKCVVRRSKQISRLPDISPAAVMLIIIGGNTFGFNLNASASVPPFCTYD